MVKDVNEQDIIQFVGVSDLSAAEQDTVQVLSRDYHEKIKRQLNNLTDISVHVKVYEKEGNRKKYSVHLKVAAPTVLFAADKADSWELPAALHSAFQDIQSQIKHRLHTDTTKPDRPRN